jgi:hypothetical protein
MDFSGIPIQCSGYTDLLLFPLISWPLTQSAFRFSGTLWHLLAEHYFITCEKGRLYQRQVTRVFEALI